MGKREKHERVTSLAINRFLFRFVIPAQCRNPEMQKYRNTEIQKYRMLPYIPPATGHSTSYGTLQKLPDIPQVARHSRSYRTFHKRPDIPDVTKYSMGYRTLHKLPFNPQTTVHTCRTACKSTVEEKEQGRNTEKKSRETEIGKWTTERLTCGNAEMQRPTNEQIHTFIWSRSVKKRATQKCNNS